MLKAFIGYASMSGNTEDIANIIQEVLAHKGCEVEMQCLDTVDADTLSEYDCVFIGAYTWGDGDLPYEAEDFFDELDALKFNGLNAACFGSGDRAYPKYCAAVDLLANKLAERGCHVFDQLLKIELNPETDAQIKECKEFAENVYSWSIEKKGKSYV
ncbi:flavodoxin [Cytobacillus spongiae]|uniref:flavodoxin n=1 Tax=Cytobacillus spongiae TaxID=2901381 RepID=UPI001F356CC2|nr:flavodoxin [Cytobacillus spongiae]UII57549.1 flavodoxin [Cytobacillus spongiae]